jgi:ribosomal protein L11 methyltransferase
VGEARWLEVSLTVDGELAEAVAEVIGRFTSQGVVMEQAVEFNDAEDEGTPYGPVKVFGYIVVDSTLEQKRQHLEEALWHLSRIQELPPLKFRKIEDEDWMAAWKQHYHPIPIGQRLLILPAWLESNHPDRVPIKIDPSMAFGTGTHPSTQLCLALVEKYVQEGQAVIDVGCGSGILSIAAVKLGAKKALAVDIDNAAIRSTQENAIANEIEDRIDCGVGSVDEILQGCFILRQAPLVLANILAPVIGRLFEDGMAELINPDGVIILSGILVEQASEVKAKAEGTGLVEVDRAQMGDWVALVYKKTLPDSF